VPGLSPPAARESRSCTTPSSCCSDAGLRLKNRALIFVLNRSKRLLTCSSANTFKQSGFFLAMQCSVRIAYEEDTRREFTRNKSGIRPSPLILVAPQEAISYY